MANETQTVGPPPAPEVALRTLEGDAKSIAAGEVDPQAEIVHPTAPTPNTPQAVTVEQPAAQSPPASGGKSKAWLWILIIVLVLAIIGAVLFFVLPQLTADSDSTTIEVTTDN